MQFLGVGNGFRRRLSVAYAASVTLDCSLADIFDITLTGNIAIDFTNGNDGQPVLVRLKQDATGGRTWSPGAKVRVGTDIPSVTLTTTANKKDYLGFAYDAVDDRYDLVSYNKGF